MKRDIKKILASALPPSGTRADGSGVEPTAEDLAQNLANLHRNLVDHVRSFLNDRDPDVPVWEAKAKRLIEGTPQ